MLDTSIFFPARQRVRRKRKAPGTTSAGLTLVAATYEPSSFVSLTFDRAVDIADINVAAITVDDGMSGFRFIGTGTAELTSPTTVYVILDGLEELPFEGIHLNVTNANGIVASESTEVWGGCEDLELPFP